jgi:hypothetical protein
LAGDHAGDAEPDGEGVRVFNRTKLPEFHGPSEKVA